MNIGELRGAENALGIWALENVLAAGLAYTAWRTSAFPDILFGLIVAFVVVQLIAPFVWAGYRLPLVSLLHTVQAITRLCFYLGTIALIGMFASGAVKAVALVGVPALIIGYFTDYIWYESTIAP